MCERLSFAGLALSLALVAGVAGNAHGEVQELSAGLTPIGAERAGNKEGTIPSWTGGFTASSPGYSNAAPRRDLFAGEKPLFSITSSNYRRYSDNLPEGAKFLFKKYPDYRMDIYPSHRTAALPSAVYENIARNASRARAAPEGIAYGVEGAAGGIPFPQAKNGLEAVWNHLLAYWGPARERHLRTYVVTADGVAGLASSYREGAAFPFYYPDGTPQSYGGHYFKTLHINDGPPGTAGQGYLTWQPI